MDELAPDRRASGSSEDVRGGSRTRPSARGRARAVAVSLVLAAALTGCDDPAAPAPDESSAFATGAAPGPGWTSIGRSAFSFELPPGFVDADQQPSRTSGRYLRERDGTTLAFDFAREGPGIRPPPEATRVRQAWTRIGGRRVHLARWTADGSGVVRGWWRRVASADGEVYGLLLGGTFTGLDGVDHLLAAIRSVRFP